MRKLLKKIWLIIILVSLNSYSQIINIPDANFKAKLLAANSTSDVAKNNLGVRIKIDSNSNNEIDESEALQVSYLDVSFSNISSLVGVNSFLNLTYLTCNNNSLSSINVDSLSQLVSIGVRNNQLTTLNLTNNLNLFSIYAQFNLLTSLTFGSNIINLICQNNLLTNIDISSCKSMSSVNLDNNNLLQLNLKNGKLVNLSNLTNGDPDIMNVIFANNPSVKYVCSEFDISNDPYIIDNNYTNCVFNSYCSFTPGGIFNTIAGANQYNNNNSNCNNSNPIFQNQRVNISDGINLAATFSNNLGNYLFNVQQPNLTLTPYFENPSYFVATPAFANINFPINNNLTQTQDFCITPNGVHNDLEIVIVPVVARAGFDSKYQLVYKNKGNQTLSGTINLTFDDVKTDFVSSLPIVDSQTLSNLSWNYSNLFPFETRIIDLVLNINSPIEIPSLNAGDILNFTATINPITGDDLPLDNVFNLNQIVVNSYDPNQITCLEGDSQNPSEIGEYLHYNVQFENTGNADAINVVVKDIIDSDKYDINTLQVLHSSNNVRTDIKSNIVEFIFENINLARKSGNPPVGGHGDVLFKMKTKPTLNNGDSVLNKANIYFDYNFPIITNDAITTFATLSNLIFKIDESVSVYPNPTNSKININANNNVKSIEMYDTQGRILETVLNANRLDISNKTNGIYFLKITTDKGSKIEKIIKE